MPKRLSIDENNDHLKIAIRWFQLSRAAIFACVVVLGAAAFFGLIAASSLGLLSQTSDVTQLFVEQYSTHSEGGLSSGSYSVRALLKSGEKRDLVVFKVGASDIAASVIEEKIEKFLGIEDRPVKGEVTRVQDFS